eukprot:748493-Hanusia_phi.AAC.1
MRAKELQVLVILSDHLSFTPQRHPRGRYCQQQARCGKKPPSMRERKQALPSHPCLQCHIAEALHSDILAVCQRRDDKQQQVEGERGEGNYSSRGRRQLEDDRRDEEEEGRM